MNGSIYSTTPEPFGTLTPVTDVFGHGGVVAGVLDPPGVFEAGVGLGAGDHLSGLSARVAEPGRHVLAALSRCRRFGGTAVVPFAPALRVAVFPACVCRVLGGVEAGGLLPRRELHAWRAKPGSTHEE